MKESTSRNIFVAQVYQFTSSHNTKHIYTDYIGIRRTLSNGHKLFIFSLTLTIFPTKK